jgi:autotransporter-associated beta strand protein
MADSTWNGNSSNIGDYNDPGNWNNGVPGNGDTANFGVSNTIDIFLETSLQIGTWHFLAGASQYNFIIGGPPNSGFLTVTSIGILVDGGSCHISDYGLIEFNNNSSTGAATIDDYGNLWFFASSNADTSTITTQPGGLTRFTDHSQPKNAQLITDAGGTVNFFESTGPLGDHKLTAGSIAGAGTYDLGADQLTVLSGNVSGLIEGTGGSLVKVGPGTLTLSGAGNTYSNGTTVEGGIFDVAAVGAAGIGPITFAGKATLKVENAALLAHHFGNPIDNFANHDVLDLAGLHFHAGATATYHKATHNLIVHSGGRTDTFTLNSPQSTHFNAANDHHGGTEVFLVFA